MPHYGVGMLDCNANLREMVKFDGVFDYKLNTLIHKCFFLYSDLHGKIFSLKIAKQLMVMHACFFG